MVWPFRRKPDDMDVDTLLARANAASPPTHASGGSFQMTVGDVFVIAGRGLVATGKVGAGTVTVGLKVRVERAGQVVASSKVVGIEQFRKVRDSASVGENVGLLLDRLTRDDISPGDVLTG